MTFEGISSEHVSFINGQFQELYKGFQEQITLIQGQSSCLDDGFGTEIANLSGVLSPISDIGREFNLESQTELASLYRAIPYMTLLNQIYIHFVNRVASQIERQLSDVDTELIDTPRELDEVMVRGNLGSKIEKFASSDEHKLLEQMQDIWVGFGKVSKSYEAVCGDVDIETLYRISNENGEFINPILGRLNDYLKNDQKYDLCAEGLKKASSASILSSYGISALR